MPETRRTPGPLPRISVRARGGEARDTYPELLLSQLHPPADKSQAPHQSCCSASVPNSSKLSDTSSLQQHTQRTAANTWLDPVHGRRPTHALEKTQKSDLK
ncbi:hypothetical protein VZT92_017725 [Zoarces viviparus]|uniref:Uncharacterized protein n=1 Tax=Zoarces viviparus TaxID=48416 RepID=A0AAW1ENU7_ZOAVI